MERNELDLKQALEYIEPMSLSYQEWVGVGMGLKEAGYPASVWDDWSKRDARRYHAGECARKWETFRGTDTPITAGTIVQMALTRGWQPGRTGGHELGWEDEIGAKDEPYRVVDPHWVEGRDIAEPKEWHPAQQLITYLEALFDSTENVGYVTRSFEKDGKYMPTKGDWSRTAGQLIEALSHCKDDVGAVLGDYNPAVGAWIRFNPLDGKGVRNENVAEFRYALVECDGMELEQQNALIRELELPVACLVHSGGKSLHAIVHIDAADYAEYRKRVEYLYAVCRRNGLELDQQNRNPSRLSRMPGVMRNGKKQFLVDTNIGKANFAEWQEWIESVTDDLPDPESMADVWDNLPDLAPSLIGGVLRQGHKMLLAGPSKAGKSYALIELVIAIAEGRSWLGFDCAKGKVLYVNLELDRASCLHRFRDVYDRLGWKPAGLRNIDIWNLRGKSIPMDKLAPKLIRRALKKDYIAVVIDPIYKIITGDENSADQMAAFCNQFDKVCTELGCAVIYCHHHSKGNQGGKRSMDRASGSGVFARDPDALLDLIELEVSDDLRKQVENNEVCKACGAALEKAGQSDEVSQDTLCSQREALDACKRLLSVSDYNTLLDTVADVRREVQARTAWRIEGTLREFPKFPPVNLWFEFPIHRIDHSGMLSDVHADSDAPDWKRGREKKKPVDKRQERLDKLRNAFAACDMEGKGEVSIADLAEYCGLSRNTVKTHVDEHPDFERQKDGTVRRVSTCQNQIDTPF
ncbi:AAA family ATPase [Agathobaculum sp.]|uniref:AAA family ATPase n=1 Tax=Agathobaculum sp. TaxID=2048138 RepID=UPI00399F92E8